jgi:hypothetical protein
MQELQQLYQQHAGQLNLIHVSAMFKQLTRLAEQQQHQQQQQWPPQPWHPQQDSRNHHQQQQQQEGLDVSWLSSMQGQQPSQQQLQWDLSTFLQQLELHSMQLLSQVQVRPLLMLKAAAQLQQQK